MNFFDIIFGGAPATTGSIRYLAEQQAKSAEKIRAQIRRTASLQSESVESLAQENRELRLYLTAVVQLLVEKGLLKPEELQAKVISLLPPIPTTSPEEENPFADLGR